MKAKGVEDVGRELLLYHDNMCDMYLDEMLKPGRFITTTQVSP